MAANGFLIDVEKCTGCKLCVISCKDEHVDNDYMPWTRPQPATGHFWMDVKSLERGTIPRVKMSYLPVLCQHCANAPCIKACPDNAIKTRDDGLVWIDPAACTNCGLCAPACPYDVIFMNSELGIAQKCTGCAHRVDEGGQPRCAEVCPHEAIVYGDVADAGNGAPLEVFHPEYNAEPRVHWKGLPKPWIAGTIVDPAGDEVVQGAKVTAVDLFDDDSVDVRSDAFGDFWIKGLRHGRKYRIEATKDGYRDFVAVVTTDGDQDVGTVELQRKS
jgi:Fe-S-cluster-containing dehydrogenase component